jgi:hypothetical protein
MEAPRAMTSAVQHLEQLVRQVRATGHFDQSKRYPSVSFTLGPNEFLIDHGGFLLRRHLVNALATAFKLEITMVRTHTERFEFGNSQTKSRSITCDSLGCRSSTGLREPCSVNYVVRYHLTLPYDPSYYARALRRAQNCLANKCASQRVYERQSVPPDVWTCSSPKQLQGPVMRFLEYHFVCPKHMPTASYESDTDCRGVRT